jgi:arabinose-5-phosphate isomerase
MTDLSLARKVLETEAAAVLALADRIDDRFAEAARLVSGCTGRVVLTGMGKSGIVARKIAATFSSTGTASFFLHPAEALHGDLGVLRAGDVVIALSYSGENQEILVILETLERLGVRFIAITGVADSTLARSAAVALDCRVSEEACPMKLVPTASTTAMLALGDALAMTVLVEKGFREQDFAHLHPNGDLGKQLTRVVRWMHQGEDVPAVHTDTAMRELIYEMNRKGLGMACVVDGERRLLGIITDGDLRRHMGRSPNALDACAHEVMTANPVTIDRNTLVTRARHLLEERKITSIVVVDSERRVEGVVHLHDLW